MDTGLLLEGGTLIDGTGAPPLPDSYVVIRDGTILAVGQGKADLPRLDGCTSLDTRGLVIMPGFIDAHVHLTNSAGDDPVADMLAADDEQLLRRSAANAESALRSGLTTLRDCGGRHGVALVLRNAIAGGQVAGPRIIGCGMPVTTPEGHCYWMGLTAAGVEAVRRAAASQFDAGADFIKVMASGGNATPTTDPSSPQYSVDELHAVVDVAHARGRAVAAHAHSAESVRRAVAAGIDTIEHCSWLAPQGDGYDSALVELMAARGTVVSPAVTYSVRTPVEEAFQDPAQRERRRRMQAIRYRTGRLMHDAGLRFIFGTDAGARRTRFEEWPLAIPVLVERFGFTPMEVVLAGTSESARALGVSDQVGTVVPGKRADLIGLRGDPLSDLTAYRQVALVIHDGKIVVSSRPPGTG